MLTSKLIDPSLTNNELFPLTGLLLTILEFKHIKLHLLISSSKLLFNNKLSIYLTGVLLLNTLFL